MKKILLVSAFSSALILSACSSDDVAEIIAGLEVTVSGQITNISDVGETGVTIEGVYTDPGGLLNPTTASVVGGNFSLPVLKGDSFYLHASKTGFATINTARATLSVDETGVELGIPTLIETQDVITLAFTATSVPTFKDADKAWLVVDVALAANGDEVDGATISPLPAPDARVYTDCNGADAFDTTTVAPCPTRPGPMYIAYFNAPAEILVTVGSETQTATVRLGEITVLEFEQ